jgi:copper chaperone CopZ
LFLGVSKLKTPSNILFTKQLRNPIMKNIIIFVFAFIANMLYSNMHAQAVADTLKTAEIKVRGITCNDDMPLIKKKLINNEGIDEVTFSEAKAGTVVFKISYHTSFINDKKICEIIEAAPSCDDPQIFPYKAKLLVQAAQKPKK